MACYYMGENKIDVLITVDSDELQGLFYMIFFRTESTPISNNVVLLRGKISNNVVIFCVVVLCGKKLRLNHYFLNWDYAAERFSDC